jgi:hypothetical protein
MPEKHSDDWSSAWSERYGADEEPASPRRRRLRLPLIGRTSRPGRYALATGALIAVAASPFAVAASKNITGSKASFTGSTGRYVELARNTRSGDGGATADACNSNQGNEACLNMINKGTGWAASFRTRGLTGFRLQTSGNGTATPFLLDKNATGLVKYLNADSVDGLSAEQIGREQFGQVLGTTATPSAPRLGNQNGATGVTRAAAGDYRVAFANDVSKCTYQATSADPTAARTLAAVIDPANPKQVRVVERAGAAAGTPPPADGDLVDGDFQLAVNC